MLCLIDKISTSKLSHCFLIPGAHIDKVGAIGWVLIDCVNAGHMARKSQITSWK